MAEKKEGLGTWGWVGLGTLGLAGVLLLSGQSWAGPEPTPDEPVPAWGNGVEYQVVDG